MYIEVLNTKITIKMLHWLQFSSFRLLPVLRHKSKVAYSSSAVGPSSSANCTSNWENHASRSSNNQQALMRSISLCICPPLLQCPGGNLHRVRHSQNHSSPERSPDENSESGFSWTYCTPVSDMRIEVLPQDPCSYSVLLFPRKPVTTSQKAFFHNFWR